MEKVYILLALFLIAAAVYLNRSYAYFYDYVGLNYQTSPYLTDTYIIEGKPSTSLNKDETLKLVSLGDSLTAGVGSKDYKNTYPYLIAQTLLKKSFEVTLVNLAKPGATTSDVLSSQVPRAITENPDYITLLIGINDIHNLVPENKFIENYQEILDKLTKKTHAKITVIDIPLLGTQLMPFPYNYYYLYKTLKYNVDIKNLTAQYNVKFVDLYSDTKNAFLGNPNYYSVDRFHPSDSGYIYWESFVNVN